MTITNNHQPSTSAQVCEAQPSGVPSRMRAVTQATYGSSEVLEFGTREVPSIKADEVLIEVVAAGIDRGVWHLMTGLPYLVRLAGYGVLKPKNPVLGMDAAGRVVKVGADVTRFVVGDEVFGFANGSFAEFASAKACKLAHKPANISFEQVAVSAVSGVTALQALTTVGQMQAGQHVLVIGANGGVGSFAVQLAKALGATVTGVASTAALDDVRRLGADHVIDYTTQDFVGLDHRFDLIIDTGGRNSLARLRTALTTKGTLVIVGGEDGNRFTGGIGRQLRGALTSPFIEQQLKFFICEESFESVNELGEYMAEGAVVPSISRRFPLEDVPVALAAMEAGMLSAKSVVTVQDGSSN